MFPRRTIIRGPRLTSAAWILIGLGLNGCASRDIGYAQSRVINADIAAVHENGPTALYPGQKFTGGNEPKGAYPWQLSN
jgi:hypothetical protein